MRPPIPPYRRQYALLAYALTFSLFCPISLLAQVTQWGGLVSTGWRNASNWNAGVPNSTKSARISVTDFDPYVPVPTEALDTARTLDLEIQNGGQLFFDSAGVLIIHGSQLTIQNLGAINLGYGKLISRGDITFFNGGDFNAGGGTLEFAGLTWNNKSGSSFDPGTSTVVFNGSSSQTLIVNDSLVGGITFYNLEIKTEGTVSITGNVTATNSVVIGEGTTLNIPAGSSFSLAEGCTIENYGTVMGAGSYPSGLPVQMTSFTAIANRLDAVLQWATATEVNNFGFEIQRKQVQSSMFNVQSSTTLNLEPGTWNKVGFVSGSGTSTSPKDYSYVDANLPAGRYAYRIKQIDFGGAATYYDAAEVEVGMAAKELSLGSNYPNPFNPTTTIEFTLPEAGRATLRVFNMIGQEVATLFDQNAEAGRLYRVTYSAATLPSGLYFYRLEFSNRSIVKQMILVK